MHAEVTLLSYTLLSSGKSHSHLQTASSPECWSVSGQRRRAQQERLPSGEACNSNLILNWQITVNSLEHGVKIWDQM